MMLHPTLSIIVPVHNGERTIARCLAHLLSSELDGPFEVIVVDDGSTDGTSAIVREQRDVRLVRTGARAGPARARNLGAAHARGDDVLFVDADMLVKPSTARALLAALRQHPEACAVIGAQDTVCPWPNLTSQYRNLRHHCNHARSSGRLVPNFWSGCGLIRREMLRRVGGFDERLTSACVEDVDLGYRLQRLGAQVVLCADITAVHDKRWTLGQALKVDLLHRAVPWTGLLWRHGLRGRHVDVQPCNAVCAGLALAGAVALFLPWGGALTLLCLVGIALLERRFLGFLRRQRGAAFTAQAFWLHVLYFLAGAVGLVVGTVLVPFQRARVRRPVPSLHADLSPASRD